MGTLFRIVLYASSEDNANVAADSAFKHIEALNDLLSDYKPDSELNRLSASSGSGRFIKVSRPLFLVLDTAQRLAKETAGSFDVTVGPYVQLWRNLHSQRSPSLPGSEVINKAGYSVGFQYVSLDRQNLSAQLSRTDMQLDLGGIAKGYAADEALRILKLYGIHSALIDAGGDITLGDPPPGKEGWLISIPVHNQNGEKDYLSLVLGNQAVATSGDLFQYVEIDGKRYSHIIDPHTGLGLTDQSSVTIIAPDGITADSYASAVSVMGPTRGLKFIESKPGVEVYMEYHEEGSILRQKSSNFIKLKEVTASN